MKIPEQQLQSYKQNWMISREEKIRMVSVTDDDLVANKHLRDIYNFHQCQHTAWVAETTSDHWRQRFEEENRKLDLTSTVGAKRKRLYKHNLTY